MRSAGYVILIQDMRNAYKILIAKLKKWNSNIKTNLQETRRDGMN